MGEEAASARVNKGPYKPQPRITLSSGFPASRLKPHFPGVKERFSVHKFATVRSIEPFLNLCTQVLAGERYQVGGILRLIFAAHPFRNSAFEVADLFTLLRRHGFKCG